MSSRSYTLTVRYAETDAQGVVHHANYLTWFEEGRSDFLRQVGMNYSSFEEAGFFCDCWPMPRLTTGLPLFMKTGLP